MPITWQSVAAPSFGAENQLAVQAGNQVTRGIESLGKSARNIEKQQVTNRQADLQNQLLSLAANPDVGEKQFLAQAIKLGKENNLTPKQALSQIEEIKGVRDQAAALTTEQQLEYDNRKANIDAAAQLSSDAIKHALFQFDQQNSQLVQEQAKVNAFSAGGGLGTVMEKVYGGIEDDGDRQETREAVLKWRQENNYDDYVVAQTVEQFGVGEEGVLFDGTLFDDAKFKRALKFNQERFELMKNKAIERRQLQQNLEQLHAKDLKQKRDELLAYQRETTQGNLKGFSF